MKEIAGHDAQIKISEKIISTIAKQARILDDNIYLTQLEINNAENKLTEIQNEKLQLEIDSKNSELINFTMHLVQKGELLTDLKSHMSKVTKLIDNPIAHEELKKMIKVINDADKMDKDWENFTNHFDKAHNSFTINIKEKYPKLTANELKLCTFLRVNLHN